MNFIDKKSAQRGRFHVGIKKSAQRGRFHVGIIVYRI